MITSKGKDTRDDETNVLEWNLLTEKSQDVESHVCNLHFGHGRIFVVVLGTAYFCFGNDLPLDDIPCATV